MTWLWILWTACAPPAPDAGVPPGYRQTAEAPIQVLVNAHGHNYQTSATPTDPDWWDIKTDHFWTEHAALMALIDQVEAAGGLLSAQLSGEFARDAVLLAPESLPELRAALDRGHSFGAHFHDEALETDEEWQPLREDGLTDGEHSRIWDDHIAAVEAMAGRTVVRVDAAESIDELDTQLDLENRHDVRLGSAGDPFSYTPWAHAIWTPVRVTPGLTLTEDPDGYRVRVGMYPQIGKEEPAGLHVLPTTVAQLQRHFLQTLAQWNRDQLDPDTPRLWTFGVMTHPGQEDLSLEELDRFLGWLDDTFGDQVGPSGVPVYELVSDEQILDRYQDWERRWPGESSFDFDFEGWLDGACPDYPYPLEGLALGLRDAELEQEMRLEPGVSGWQLRQREVTRGERKDSGFAKTEVGDLGATLWVIQSRNGSEHTLDLRQRLPTDVVGVDLETGTAVDLDLSALAVGPIPVVLINDATALETALEAVACERAAGLSPDHDRPARR